MAVSGTAETDDRGEYRIYFITPGRYYLNAGTPQGPGWSGRIRPTLNAIPAAYPSTYFPGVATLRLATAIEIKTGSELGGVDWTLRQQRLYSVRGRVMDATTGQSPPKAELRLTYEDLSGDGANKGTYENGVFEFRNIVPGLYGLTATDASGREVYSRGYMPIEVTDSDIDGLVLQVSTGASITGRVRLDRSNSPMPAFVEGTVRFDSSVNRIQKGPFVELSPVVTGSTQRSPRQFFFYASLNPDWTFFIPNVTPGEYDIRFWLQPSFYIQKALYGGTDVLTRPLHFTGEKSSALEIVLASDVGSLSGSVTSPLGVAPGAQVVLVPNGMRHRVELFRTALTNQEGHFTISNVVPGHYRVFAWEVIEENSWFDPAVLGRSESLARSIHIAESSAQTIELRAIPTQ
jgi:protocatechuate 3,4-dioxygenase beta subunit